MTTSFGIWLAAGAALGILHAWLIWKASQPPFYLAGGAVLRLLPVAGGLFLAAISGGLIPAAVGWATAFFLSVASIALRKTT